LKGFPNDMCGGEKKDNHPVCAEKVGPSDPLATGANDTSIKGLIRTRSRAKGENS